MMTRLTIVRDNRYSEVINQIKSVNQSNDVITHTYFYTSFPPSSS